MLVRLAYPFDTYKKTWEDEIGDVTENDGVYKLFESSNLVLYVCSKVGMEITFQIILFGFWVLKKHAQNYYYLMISTGSLVHTALQDILREIKT